MLQCPTIQISQLVLILFPLSFPRQSHPDLELNPYLNPQPTPLSWILDSQLTAYSIALFKCLTGITHLLYTKPNLIFPHPQPSPDQILPVSWHSSSIFPVKAKNMGNILDSFIPHIHFINKSCDYDFQSKPKIWSPFTIFITFTPV